MPTNLEILRKSKSELMKIKINLKSEALHVKLLLTSIKCLMTVNYKKQCKNRSIYIKEFSLAQPVVTKEILVDKDGAQNIQIRNTFTKHLRIHIVVSDFAKKFRDL